jgi:hypothetical protein
MGHRLKSLMVDVGYQIANIGQKKFLFWAMPYALCVFFAFSFLAGCAVEKPSLVVRSYPFNPRGKAVLVQHFAINPEISTSLNKGAVQRFGELIALDIQRLLKGAGFQHPLVIVPGEEAKGDFLVKGTITRVHGGDARERNRRPGRLPIGSCLLPGQAILLHLAGQRVSGPGESPGDRPGDCGDPDSGEVGAILYSAWNV